MISFKQYLAETSSPLKRELLAKFGGDAFTEQPYAFTQTDIISLRHILDKHIFNQTLDSVPVKYVDFNEIRMELRRRDASCFVPSTLLGVHSVVETHEDANQIKTIDDIEFDMGSEIIMLNGTNLKDYAFAFTAATLCHEMIHAYDMRFGEYKDAFLIQLMHGIHVNFHSTPTFKRKMKTAKTRHINVVASTDGIDYSKLSEDAVRELAKLNEHSSKQLDCNKTIGNTHVIKGRHIALIDID